MGASLDSRRANAIFDRRLAQTLPLKGLVRFAIMALPPVALSVQFVVQYRSQVEGLILPAARSGASWTVLTTLGAAAGVMALIGLVIVVLQLRALLRASSRVAGPLLRLQQVLAQLGGGQTSQRVRFRTDDQRIGLATALNLRIAWLDGCYDRLKAGLPHVSSRLSQIRVSLLSDGSVDDAEARALDSELGVLIAPWRESRAVRETVRPERAADPAPLVPAIVDPNLASGRAGGLAGITLALMFAVINVGVLRLRNTLETLPAVGPGDVGAYHASLSALLRSYYFGGLAVAAICAGFVVFWGRLRPRSRLSAMLALLERHFVAGAPSSLWRPLTANVQGELGYLVARLNSTREAADARQTQVLVELETLREHGRGLKGGAEEPAELLEQMEAIIDRLRSQMGLGGSLIGPRAPGRRKSRRTRGRPTHA